MQEPTIKNTKRATAGDLGGGCEEEAWISSISNSKLSSARSILNGQTCIELVDYTVSNPCHIIVQREITQPRTTRKPFDNRKRTFAQNFSPGQLPNHCPSSCPRASALTMIICVSPFDLKIPRPDTNVQWYNLHNLFDIISDICHWHLPFIFATYIILVRLA